MKEMHSLLSSIKKTLPQDHQSNSDIEVKQEIEDEQNIYLNKYHQDLVSDERYDQIHVKNGYITDTGIDLNQPLEKSSKENKKSRKKKKKKKKSKRKQSNRSSGQSSHSIAGLSRSISAAPGDDDYSSSSSSDSDNDRK